MLTGPTAPPLLPALPPPAPIAGGPIGAVPVGPTAQPVYATPSSRPIISRASSDVVSDDVAATLDGARVLIVDDDVRNVFALASALEHHGMQVLYADNGNDGIQLLAEHPDIDIVLMDAMMPEQDGYETTRIIRRNPHLTALPVVFLTAKAMPGDREVALGAGASDYITKPVDLDELLRLMARWVGQEQ